MNQEQRTLSARRALGMTKATLQIIAIHADVWSDTSKETPHIESVLDVLREIRDMARKAMVDADIEAKLLPKPVGEEVSDDS